MIQSLVRAAQPDIYPMTGFLYNIVNQDVSAAGLPLSDLISCFDLCQWLAVSLGCPCEAKYQTIPGVILPAIALFPCCEQRWRQAASRSRDLCQKSLSKCLER